MRKILAFFVLLYFHTSSFAQKSFLGVDAGINVANQRIVYTVSGYSTGPGAEFFANVVKPTFGFFYQSNFSETTGVRLTAQYMSLGCRNRYGQQHDVDINYLTLPLSFHYRPGKNISLHGGGYLSFTLNNTKVIDQNNVAISITSVYHQNDTGLFLGGEHGLNENLAFAVNYFIGTKNIWLNDNNGSVKYTNRALQLTLIYKFKKPS